MTIVKNLIVPLIIVLILYAIPVVPTWRALKRKKASFGKFLGWIVGEMLVINAVLYVLSLIINPDIQYLLETKYNFGFIDLFIFAILISTLFFLFLPFILRSLLFTTESMKKANLYALVFLLIAMLEVIVIMYTIAYGVARLSKNF